MQYQDRRLGRRPLSGKVVAITGGARGLGLLMAERFARQGADLSICSRTLHQLDRAADRLRRSGVRVISEVCDVSDSTQVAAWIEKTKTQLGRIDILVNDASIIQVAPFEAFQLEDFKSAMGANFWGVVHSTLAALPELKRNRGRLMNISSIGGSIPVAHLLPYVSAKFAVTGFSLGSAAELKRSGVSVTTVIPGLMRTGSFLNAYFKGDQKREFSLFSLASSLPGISMDAERAAGKMVDACLARKSFVVVGAPAKAARVIFAALPSLMIFTMSLINRLLPKADGVGQIARNQVKPGRAIPSRIAQSFVTRMSRTAADRFNERGAA